jgi:hypothetical protein
MQMYLPECIEKGKKKKENKRRKSDGEPLANAGLQEAGFWAWLTSTLAFLFWEIES